jgi:hypothetical protein
VTNRQTIRLVCVCVGRSTRPRVDFRTQRGDSVGDEANVAAKRFVEHLRVPPIVDQIGARLSETVGQDPHVVSKVRDVASRVRDVASNTRDLASRVLAVSFACTRVAR